MDDTAECVVLVDADDRETGTMPKLAAHREGARHRAVSVFLRDGRGRVLMQRRAFTKYHSPGLWANACCSHPRPGDAPIVTAARRLREELGLEAALRDVGRVAYRAQLGNGMIEDEIVHLFIGQTDRIPVPRPDEVSEWHWTEPEALAAALESEPHRFAAWFRIYAERIPATALRALPP